jgi:hypothetical protein
MSTRLSYKRSGILIAWTFTSILLMLSLLGPIPSAMRTSVAEPTEAVELVSDDERFESEETDFWLAGSFEIQATPVVSYDSTSYLGISAPSERCPSHSQRGPPRS